MKFQPTPVTATCVKTGTVYKFPSLAAAAAEGFNQSCISRCIRGAAKQHAGFTFVADLPLKPSRTAPLRAKVLALRAEGKTVAQAAKLLGIAASTANYHSRVSA